MATRIVTFVRMRETKGTYVFQEINPATGEALEMSDPDTVIGVLYVRKKAAETMEYKGGGLIITVETVDGYIPEEGGD